MSSSPIHPASGSAIHDLIARGGEDAQHATAEAGAGGVDDAGGPGSGTHANGPRGADEGMAQGEIAHLPPALAGGQRAGRNATPGDPTPNGPNGPNGHSQHQASGPGVGPGPGSNPQAPPAGPGGHTTNPGLGGQPGGISTPGPGNNGNGWGGPQGGGWDGGNGLGNGWGNGLGNGLGNTLGGVLGGLGHGLGNLVGNLPGFGQGVAAAVGQTLQDLGGALGGRGPGDVGHGNGNNGNGPNRPGDTGGNGADPAHGNVASNATNAANNAVTNLADRARGALDARDTAPTATTNRGATDTATSFAAPRPATTSANASASSAPSAQATAGSTGVGDGAHLLATRAPSANATDPAVARADLTLARGGATTTDRLGDAPPGAANASTTAVALAAGELAALTRFAGTPLSLVTAPTVAAEGEELGVTRTALFRADAGNGREAVQDIFGRNYVVYGGEGRATDKATNERAIRPVGTPNVDAIDQQRATTHGELSTQDLLWKTVVPALGGVAALLGGAAAGTAAVMSSGGMAGPFLLTAATLIFGYGALRAGVALRERAEAGLELSPFASGDARRHWIAASANSLGSVAALAMLAI